MVVKRNGLLCISYKSWNPINKRIPGTIHAVKRRDFDVIGMVKKFPKMFFRYNGEDMSLISIYNKNKKRRDKSKYLLSVIIDVVKDGDIIPAKVVYVRNLNKRKEYICLISTDVNLDENECTTCIVEIKTPSCLRSDH